MIDEARKHEQRTGSVSGTGYVLYWMQQSQRLRYNHALSCALETARQRGIPLVVLFMMSDKVPSANARHYRFMIEGLFETQRALTDISIPIYLCTGAEIPPLLANCSLLITDTGYLRWQREWRQRVYQALPDLPYLQIESDAIVPVRLVSDKEEYSAATIRKKILRQLEKFLLPMHLQGNPRKTKNTIVPDTSLCVDLSDFSTVEDLWSYVLSRIHMDDSVKPVRTFRGGYSQAKIRLTTFLEERLSRYHDQHNDPALRIQSELSPYLHFGQISSLEIALSALEHCSVNPEEAAELILHKSQLNGIQAGLASFLEELIVRRELSFNFCTYNEDYDTIASIPSWARQSLFNHVNDPRPYQYLLDSLESAATHDIYWNSAQNEMAQTGKMHNYMRMYWGKKIIEWTPDPETAYSVMRYLNDKYQLDGRDPNSYAGIAWCFGKHDRPWQERSIFGTVRYMNMAGLERKFVMQNYINRIEHQARDQH